MLIADCPLPTARFARHPGIARHHKILFAPTGRITSTHLLRLGSGFLTDYVVITPDGINDTTTLAHEIGHACFLLHRGKQTNLMFHEFHEFNRGTSITGWQKYWFRASRHVNF